MAALQPTLAPCAPTRSSSVIPTAALRWLGLPLVCVVAVLLLPVLSLVVAALESGAQQR